MSFNNHEYSNEFYEMLYELGVFAQPDGSFGISDRLPRSHINHLYIVSFNSLLECIDFLKSELDDEISNFNSIIESLNEELSDIKNEKPNFSAKIRDDLVFSFINSLIYTAKNYKELEDTVKLLNKSKIKIFYMDDKFRERLGFYSVLLQSMDAEILGENHRMLVLDHINNNSNDSKIKNLLRYAQVSYGLEEGIGPRGRNNPLTPFSGYDYWYDRVMDGTQLHDHSGGHATEKFLGRDGYNKFKRHPELLRKKRLRLRTKPLRYLSREKRRKMQARKKKLGKNMVEPTGLVRQELATDPTNYEWWDERKNPYLWSNRGDNGNYPTWDTYR